MPLTLTQTAKRADTIGASECPVIIMGNRYPWKHSYNALSLWREKMGLQKPRKVTRAQQAGNVLELALLEQASEMLGPIHRRHLQRFHPNNAMHATLDGILIGPPSAVVELKCVGEGNRFWEDKRWGRNGSVVERVNQTSMCSGFDDDGPVFSPGLVPEEYYWQVTQQMVCYNADEIENAASRNRQPRLVDHAYVVAHTPGGTDIFRAIKIKLNPEEAGWAEQVVFNWFINHLWNQVQPAVPLTTPTLASAILAEQGHGHITDAQFNLYESLREQRREAERVARNLDSQVKALEAEMWGQVGNNFLSLRSESGHVVRKVRCHRTAQAASEYYRTELVRKQQEDQTHGS